MCPAPAVWLGLRLLEDHAPSLVEVCRTTIPGGGGARESGPCIVRKGRRIPPNASSVSVRLVAYAR
jgi:hypothetical protein